VPGVQGGDVPSFEWGHFIRATTFQATASKRYVPEHNTCMSVRAALRRSVGNGFPNDTLRLCQCQCTGSIPTMAGSLSLRAIAPHNMCQCEKKHVVTLFVEYEQPDVVLGA